ncbi:MAG TPA: ABC transporter permease [Alphaproteobacteria bacterium]|nr:ABC transporter permease [Alphaproteobacteria bacterium]
MVGRRFLQLFALAEWQLILPLGLFFLAFFLAPLVVLVVLSFQTEISLGRFTGVHYGKFLGDAFSLGILWDTMVLGVEVTMVCALFGIPLAWISARASPRFQPVLLFLVVLPILTSVVVRTFAWIVILGRQGVMNKTLIWLGLVDEPLRLLFSEFGVVMVLAQVQMPLMVLPVLTTMQRLDPNLIDASAALGAGQWRTFLRVVLPLSLPGIVAGAILVFAACVTAFVTQTLIGGARLVYMPLYIYQQAIGANNWPFAAAISVVFLVCVLFAIYLLSLVGRASRGYVHA